MISTIYSHLSGLSENVTPAIATSGTAKDNSFGETAGIDRSRARARYLLRGAEPGGVTGIDMVGEPR